MNDPRSLPVRRWVQRDTPFSFRCAGCGRCCRDKLIQVNPYEVARLAARLGLTTTETLARYTEDGVWLRREADGACCFLLDQRCSVHGDQPLACRLYPLGRRTALDRGEELVELEPHPESEGRYGVDGDVEGYLAGQEIAEYVAASDRYFAVLTRLATALERQLARGATELSGFDFGPSGERYTHAGPLPSWLDMDAVVYSTEGASEPAAPLGPWQKMQIHIERLERIAHELCEECER